MSLAPRRIALLIALLQVLLLTTTAHAAYPRGGSAAPCSVSTPTSWLHTAHGAIVDEQDCTITLKGFNLPGIEYGDATGGRSPQHLAQQITWFAHSFHMNEWRVALNAVWWNEDVAIPGANMHYRAWVQQIVKLMEQSGNYVLLTKGTQFHELPCGGSITLCTSQNQAAKDLARDPGNPLYQRAVTTGQYIDDAVAMWKSVATLYAHDPAVLYGAWNEMHHISDQVWRQNSATLIDTIQHANPRALVFFGGHDYQNGIGPLLKGSVPAFTEHNLVYDFHVYDGYSGTVNGKACNEPRSELWATWSNGAMKQIQYAEQHGAVSFSEWGGCNDTEPYNTDIISAARTHHIALSYYEAGNVVSQGQLNSNGHKVVADYAAI